MLSAYTGGRGFRFKRSHGHGSRSFYGGAAKRKSSRRSGRKSAKKPATRRKSRKSGKRAKKSAPHAYSF